MKHYKSVEFLSIFKMSSPPHKRKTPYWKLSGDGSAYQPWWFFVCSANKFDHTSHGVTAETENLHALLRHTQTYRTLHLSRFCLCGSTAVTYADNLRHVVEQAGVHNLSPLPAAIRLLLWTTVSVQVKIFLIFCITSVALPHVCLTVFLLSILIHKTKSV